MADPVAEARAVPASAAVYIVASNNEAARELRDALTAIGVRVLGRFVRIVAGDWTARGPVAGAVARQKREEARHVVTCIECADLVVAMSPCDMFEIGVAIGVDTDVLFVGVPSDAYLFYHDRMCCTSASGQALVADIVRRLAQAANTPRV